MLIPFIMPYSNLSTSLILIRIVHILTVITYKLSMSLDNDSIVLEWFAYFVDIKQRLVG